MQVSQGFNASRSPMGRDQEGQSRSHPNSVQPNTDASSSYAKRHSIAHPGHKTPNNMSRDPSTERRGRPTKRDAYLLTTMRPPELVRNIQSRGSLSETQPTFMGSRETSAHTLQSQTSHESRKSYNAHAGRTNRFKHPMNAYANDQQLETIVPHHTSILQQKYRQRSSDFIRPAASTRTSSGNVTQLSERSARQSISINMGGDLIPAFDDMNMDMDENEEAENVDDIVGAEHIEHADNALSATTSLTDAVFPTADVISKPTEERTLHSEVASESKPANKRQQQMGRIQQRIQHLKTLKDSDEEHGWSAGFSNVQQKTLLDSLNYDLQSLRRYNYRPLVSSLERIESLNIEKTSTKTAMNGPNPDPSLKSFHPLMSDLRATQRNASTTSNIQRKKPVDTEKLQRMLRKSSEVTRSIWLEASKPVSLSKATTMSSDGTYSKDFDLRTINTKGSFAANGELDRIHENFAGFKIGHTIQHLSSGSSDPSPKTNRV